MNAVCLTYHLFYLPTVSFFSGNAWSQLNSNTSLDTLSESGRDRAASTSTTVTQPVPGDTYTDTDSHAGHIDAERAYSDVPGHIDALIAAAHISRRATYGEFEQPFGDYDCADDEAYAEEMAYLLAQVGDVYFCVALYCYCSMKLRDCFSTVCSHIKSVSYLLSCTCRCNKASVWRWSTLSAQYPL